MDPGATANTKGSYAEITSSTSYDTRMLLIAFGGQGNLIRTNCRWLVDIATGSAGSETVIIADLAVGSHNIGDNVLPAYIGPIPVHIPAGTRIAARCQCDITDATDRLMDIALYGIS